ncbi:hypothetical protein AAHE18_10G084300 [Arachis hypogaea]
MKPILFPASSSYYSNPKSKPATSPHAQSQSRPSRTRSQTPHNSKLPINTKPCHSQRPQQNLSHELANSQGALLVEAADSSNIKLVRALYDALSARDSHAVLKLVASDLEWWFHGPPSCQFLKLLLTGESSSSSASSTAADSFKFVPQSVVSFGSTVIAEGCDTARSVVWVHAWTVTDGIITQVREYFNTSLTVTKIGDSDSDSDSEIIPASSDFGSFPCVWQSSLSGLAGKSVPGLVLAI